MGFPRQEYWIGLPLSPPGDLPNSGIKPMFPAWQADFLPLFICQNPVSVPLKFLHLIQKKKQKQHLSLVNDIQAEEFRDNWCYVYHLLWNVSKNKMDWWLHRKVDKAVIVKNVNGRIWGGLTSVLYVKSFSLSICLTFFIIKCCVTFF